MDEFEIEVVGAKPPDEGDGVLKRVRRMAGRMVRPVLVRPALMGFGGLAGFLVFVGTPHAGWDYQCRHPMLPEQKCMAYAYCAYYGVQGRRVRSPDRGERCPPVAFLPPDWGRLVEALRNG